MSIFLFLGGIALILSATIIISVTNGNFFIFTGEAKEYDITIGTIGYSVEYDCIDGVTPQVNIFPTANARDIEVYYDLLFSEANERVNNWSRDVCRSLWVAYWRDPQRMDAKIINGLAQHGDRRSLIIFRNAAIRKSLGQYEVSIDSFTNSFGSKTLYRSIILRLNRFFDIDFTIPQATKSYNLWLNNMFEFDGTIKNQQRLLLRYRDSDLYDLRDFFNALAALLISLGTAAVAAAGISARPLGYMVRQVRHFARVMSTKLRSAYRRKRKIS
jgi:hypothetical protein